MIYKVRCDPDHIYWKTMPCGEERVPGYSEICKDLGIVKENKFYTEEGREEGRMLSEWLLFLAKGLSPKTDPDPRIAGRVAGIRKFLAESKFKLKFGEIPQYDPVCNFAATPDIVGHLGQVAVNIDAKRGAKTKTHPLQLAAQKIALAANGFRVQESYSLYLRDNDFRLIKQDTQKHEHRWKQFVSTWHLAKEYSE